MGEHHKVPVIQHCAKHPDTIHWPNHLKLK